MVKCCKQSWTLSVIKNWVDTNDNTCDEKLKMYLKYPYFGGPKPAYNTVIVSLE